MPFSNNIISTPSDTFQNMATVKFYEGHKTAPILTSGNVSSAIISQFLEYLDACFHKLKMSEKRQKSPIPFRTDIRIDHNWVKNNRDKILSDTVAPSLSPMLLQASSYELRRKRFLDRHWELKTVRNVQIYFSIELSIFI